MALLIDIIITRLIYLFIIILITFAHCLKGLEMSPHNSNASSALFCAEIACSPHTFLPKDMHLLYSESTSVFACQITALKGSLRNFTMTSRSLKIIRTVKMRIVDDF